MKYFYLLTALTAMLVLSGCATDPYTDVWIVRSVTPPVVDNRIIYSTDFLPYTLPPSRVAAVRLNDNRIKAQVQLENVITATQVVAYKFEWLDRNGMVAPNSSWQQRVVPTGGSVTLEASSPSVNYDNFRLNLSSAQLLRIVQED